MPKIGTKSFKEAQEDHAPNFGQMKKLGNWRKCWITGKRLGVVRLKARHSLGVVSLLLTMIRQLDELEKQLEGMAANLPEVDR